MFTATRNGRTAIAVAAAVGTLALAGCSNGDPLNGGSSEGDGDGTTITIGSQAYYSSDIIAEIYAQALEAEGFTVERQLQIGQREVYVDALESGEIDFIPDYSGNLLQFFDDQTEARSSEEVAAALPDALPEGLAVLDYAPAQDADSYNVSTEFSETNGITSLADLADFDGEITIGGNAELQDRPYGVQGLLDFYGVEVGFATIGDSGGPLTKQAILDGTITMGDIYTSDPDLLSGDFVTLEDPENLILAQNVIPLVSENIADQVSEVANAVSALLTTDELVELNRQSVEDERDAASIAGDWLEEQGLN